MCFQRHESPKENLFHRIFYNKIFANSLKLIIIINNILVNSYSCVDLCCHFSIEKLKLCVNYQFINVNSCYFKQLNDIFGSNSIKIIILKKS